MVEETSLMKYDRPVKAEVIGKLSLYLSPRLKFPYEEPMVELVEFRIRVATFNLLLIGCGFILGGINFGLYASIN